MRGRVGTEQPKRTCIPATPPPHAAFPLPSRRGPHLDIVDEGVIGDADGVGPRGRGVTHCKSKLGARLGLERRLQGGGVHLGPLRVHHDGHRVAEKGWGGCRERGRAGGGVCSPPSPRRPDPSPTHPTPPNHRSSPLVPVQLADAVDDRLVPGVVAVAHVEARDVHPGRRQLAERGGRRRGGADGANDLRAPGGAEAWGSGWVGRGGRGWWVAGGAAPAPALAGLFDTAGAVSG